MSTSSDKKTVLRDLLTLLQEHGSRAEEVRQYILGQPDHEDNCLVLVMMYEAFERRRTLRRRFWAVLILSVIAATTLIITSTLT